MKQFYTTLFSRAMRNPSEDLALKVEAQFGPKLIYFNINSCFINKPGYPNTVNAALIWNIGKDSIRESFGLDVEEFRQAAWSIIRDSLASVYEASYGVHMSDVGPGQADSEEIYTLSGRTDGLEKLATVSSRIIERLIGRFGLSNVPVLSFGDTSTIPPMQNIDLDSLD